MMTGNCKAEQLYDTNNIKMMKKLVSMQLQYSAHINKQ